MKKIKCQGENCSEELVPGEIAIWFWGNCCYCWECYIKIIDKFNKISRLSRLMKEYRKIATSRSKSNKKLNQKKVNKENGCK